MSEAAGSLKVHFHVVKFIESDSVPWMPNGFQRWEGVTGEALRGSDASLDRKKFGQIIEPDDVNCAQWPILRAK